MEMRDAAHDRTSGVQLLLEGSGDGMMALSAVRHRNSDVNASQTRCQNILQPGEPPHFRAGFAPTGTAYLSSTIETASGRALDGAKHILVALQSSPTYPFSLPVATAGVRPASPVKQHWLGLGSHVWVRGHAWLPS